MSQKIKYCCKNCSWTTSIRAEWADMRPKRCMNKKCNTSFITNPEALEVATPAPAPSRQPSPHPHSGKKKKRNEESDSQ